MRNVIEKEEYINKDKDIFVRLTKYDDSALIYTVRVWTSKDKYWDLKFNLLENVKKTFDKEKIEIPYNQMDVHIKNSEEEFMKDEKQIVLFLKKGSVFNQVQIAAKINEKFSELGIPMTLPYEIKNPSGPLVVFNKGFIELSLNYEELTFIYDRNNKDALSTIIRIMSFLEEEEDFNFVRFGYVSTFMRSKKDKEKYIDMEFKRKEEFEGEFNVSKYKSVLIDSVRVNVWQRNLTDNLNGIPFVTVIDINTPIDEEYNITSEFVADFLPACDNFIEEII